MSSFQEGEYRPVNGASLALMYIRQAPKRHFLGKDASFGTGQPLDVVPGLARGRPGSSH